MTRIFGQVTRTMLTLRNTAIPIDTLSLADVANVILAGKNEPRWSYVVTPNLHHLELVDRGEIDPEIYVHSDICSADGWPVVWLAKRQNQVELEQVRGSDLLELILKSPGEGRPIVFVGGDGGESYARLANRAVEAGWIPTREPAPRAELVDDVTRNALLKRVSESGDGGVVIFGVGVPRQEELAAAMAQQSGSGWALALGMAINFSAGSVRRAPEWMRSNKLEWVHRAFSEPLRLIPRYASNLRFLASLVVRPTLAGHLSRGLPQ